MPQTQPSLQISINFFLQTNGWILYITKSHFSRVEGFWTRLPITDNEASYHGLSGDQPRSYGFFPNAQQLIGFLVISVALS